MSRAAGITMNELTRNLSLILHPCVEVATTVVSEMKERLSPKNEPPTTTAVIMGTLTPVEWATPAAMGTRATMVPTLVPMESEMKQAARKRPASSMLPGKTLNVRFTVASMLPMVLAELANAPANTNIQSMSIMFCVPAPREKASMRFVRVYPPDIATA